MGKWRYWTDERTGELIARVPYGKGFAKLAMEIGGWWDRRRRVWRFPADYRHEAISLIEDYQKITDLFKDAPKDQGKATSAPSIHPAQNDTLFSDPVSVQRTPLRFYHASVRPVPTLHPEAVLLALVYDPPPIFRGYEDKPQLRFFISFARKVGPLPFLPRHRLFFHKGQLFSLSERFLPEEVELAVRWGRAGSFALRELPEGVDEGVRRFVKTGAVGVCPSCGGPLWGDPFGYLRKVQAVCLKCGRAVEKDWGG